MIRFDIAQLTGIRRSLLMLLGASLLALVVFATLPPGPKLFHVLQKLGHPCVFALIAIIALLLQRYVQQPASRKPWTEYLRALLTAVLLGAATELAQQFTHRSASIRDVWLDAQGAICGLAICAGLDQRCRPESSLIVVRQVYLLIAGIVASLILSPLAWAVICYADRGLRFPTIVDPASPLERYFLQASDPPLRLLTLPAVWARASSERALRVRLLRVPYAGLQVEEPSPDWSRYSNLSLDLVNPTDFALELNIRVNDRTHNQRYEDRFNRQYSMPARTRAVFEIPLATIRLAPRGRAMDMRHIAMVGIFRSGANQAAELLLVRIWLH